MWHSLSPEELTKKLKTNQQTGLSSRESAQRLKESGPNILPAQHQTSFLIKFLSQFANLLVGILLLATIVSFLLGDIVDAIAILAIVILNAILGFYQELQAERSLQSLKKSEVTLVTVRRDNVPQRVPSSDIVPGDILLLEEGMAVAADARVLTSFSLRCDESSLTGESLPVGKRSGILPESTSLADRSNMVWRGTRITAGHAEAIICATGKHTEIGKIASFLGTSTDPETPLSLELARVGRMLTIAVTLIASLVFVLNTLNDISLFESLLSAISLAVAAIPEGLPAIVTIVLTLGVIRLARKKALVKKLAAAETLGAVNCIATDKTGTITQNKISATDILLADNSRYTIEGDGYKPEGTYFLHSPEKKLIDPAKDPKLITTLKAAVLASTASPGKDGYVGDTTEIALLVAAARAGMDVDKLRVVDKKVFEIPFTSERKMMSVIVAVNETGDHMLYCKGAPEVIIARSNLSQTKKDELLQAAAVLASQGLRSLAIAQKKITSKEVKEALEKEALKEENVEILGLIAMQDPLRPEVIAAVERARKAGVRTIMITGDQKETALAIAKTAGIYHEGTSVITEDILQAMSDEKLTEALKNGTSVFARISPLGKLRIVEAIKKLPDTMVAVTGDGVNDAPALKAAHVGVAMGITGTDVSREVADLIITDDNYATIIDAVREGRVIFANLVKFIRYLITCNTAEVVVVAGAAFLGLPLPLAPIQILWINLMTDGLPAIALGVDPPEYDVMQHPPRKASHGILSWSRWRDILIEGIVMGVIVLAVYITSLNRYPPAIAQSITFTVLALTQLIFAFTLRHRRSSVYTINPLSNKLLILSFFIVIFAHIGILHTEVGNLIFKTFPLPVNLWIFAAGMALIPLLFSEARKLLRSARTLPHTDLLDR